MGDLRGDFTADIISKIIPRGDCHLLGALLYESIMKKSNKTKEQLQRELNILKKQVTRLSKAEPEFRKTKMKLQECEEKYRNLVEKASDGIAIIQDMKFMYVNPRLAEMVGYSVKDFLNKPVTDMIHPDEMPKVVDRHKGRLAGKKVPSIYESAIKAKNGRKVLVEFNVSQNLYLGKSTTFVFVRDITKRKMEEKIQDSVYRISEAAYLAGDLQEFYQTIQKIIAELMPAKDNFYIALYDKSTNMLHFPYFVDEEEENPGPQKLGKGLTEYVFRTGRSLLASPKVFIELEKKGEVISIGPPSIDWLGVPLKISGKTIGVLTLQSYTEGVRYTEEEKNILTFIAEQIAMAIERKQAEKALRQSEEKYKTIAKNIEVGIYRISSGANGRFIEANPAIVKMFGYKSKQEFLSVDVSLLYHDPKGRISFQKKMLREGFVKNEEVLLKKKEGTPFLGSVCAVTVRDEKGKIRYFDGIVEDITERKEAEEMLKTSLVEKELLLREIHHRVKNNLQIISSLLNLQSRHVKDEPALDMFHESRDRVRSMALVHEKLYKSDDLANVDFCEYIRSLGRHLLMSYGINSTAIDLDVSVRDVFLDINTSIPCGLIINELISNSLKHAFSGRAQGKICVVLRSEKNGKLKLLVSDDGVGLPKGLDVTQTESLGLQLVTMLVEQLQGTLNLDNNKGAAFEIVFEKLDYRARH
jgi:PAS domain S-box-containing protein